MKQTILITGGTGYVGAWIVKGLLEKGHNIRLAVRDKNDVEKYNYLTEIAEENEGSSLEVFEADLLKEGSYDEAAKGCDSIVHVASPFYLDVKDAQKELIDPALKGTMNVLEAANRSKSVKKVVLTSSVAAVHGDNIDMKNQNLTSFNESHFNESSSLKHQPYSYSKVLAEKKAWEMAGEQNSWQLIVVNPSFVLGPALSQSSKSESLKMVNDIISGKYRPGVPNLYFGFVDVRDVARAHIICLENEAEGRHILAERVTDILSFINIIEDQFGNRFKLPKSNLPKWLISLIGGMFGITRKFVKNNVGIPLQLDTTKSREKLGLDYVPFEKTVKDMIDSMTKK